MSVPSLSLALLLALSPFSLSSLLPALPAALIV
jgi:hypothetical protein